MDEGFFTQLGQPGKDQKYSKQFFQQSQLQSQRKQTEPGSGDAAAEGGWENGLPFHLMVLAVEQQGSGGGGDKIEQVDALGDFLRERCQCGEVYHQYGAPPMPKPERMPVSSPTARDRSHFSIRRSEFRRTE